MSIERAEGLAEQLRDARIEGGAFRLPPRSLIRISGPDAFRYLNGQVTRDLGRLKEGEALPACILTPKGKLCATLFIHRSGPIDFGVGKCDLLVESPLEVRELLIERLERYIVADDVVLKIEDDPGGIHFFGKFAISGPGLGLPGSAVARLGVPGLDVEPRSAEKVAPPLLDPRVVEVLRIERRIPLWGSELDTKTLPPEAGLDFSHIDYDRGCYPGQEVISRLKSIGRVNRSLRLLTAKNPTVIPAGTALVNSSGQRVGVITSSAIQFDKGATIALGYLPLILPEAFFALDPLTGCGTPISIVADTPQ